MSMGFFFLAVKNSITASCSNRLFPQPSISTGTEPEFWIAVDSELCMVDGRFHVTAWSRIYTVFIILIKKYVRVGKNFSPSSWLAIVWYQFLGRSSRSLVTTESANTALKSSALVFNYKR
jgi:hypothetical protein